MKAEKMMADKVSPPAFVNFRVKLGTTDADKRGDDHQRGPVTKSILVQAILDRSKNEQGNDGEEHLAGQHPRRRPPSLGQAQPKDAQGHHETANDEFKRR